MFVQEHLDAFRDLHPTPPTRPPAQKGYIMDQWLGLSINLLTGQEIVKLNEQKEKEYKEEHKKKRKINKKNEVS